MSALLESIVRKKEYELTVVTTAHISEPLRIEEDGVVYWALPDRHPIDYDENKPSNIAAFRKLLSEEKPDLIELWGTEFAQVLCALRQAGDIPCVIYMQGYLTSIARHYLGGMTQKEIKRSLTFRNIIKRDSVLQEQEKYYRRAEKEKEMLSLAKNVICENDWCENSLNAAVDGLRFFRCPLSLGETFGKYRWEIENVEPYSVICNASGYPFKGLHMLFRSVAMLKEKFPQIKLYIPGAAISTEKSLMASIKKPGYTKFLEDLVKELGIEDHIVWLGRLTQEELASQYAKTRAFVLCSSIENHSSSLKEAMMVGMPCAASIVGGVAEYATHKKDALLYRFGEYDVLASYLEKMFEDDALCKNLSDNARLSIERLHSEEEIYQITSEIYQTIINGK